MPYVEVTESLREVIKSERKKRNIRGDVLSKEINKSPSYISQLERGNISTLDLNLFYKIFENIIELKGENFLEYLDGILDNSPKIKLNKKDIERETWYQNFELQLRKFPITKDIINFITNKLNGLNIDGKFLIHKINENEDLPKEYMEEPPNILNVTVDENGTIKTSIKFDLPDTFLDDIINNKTESINSINMEGILYNIFKLEGKNKIDASKLAENKLKDFKIITSRERNRLIHEAIKNNKPEEIQKYVTEIENSFNDILEEIIKYFKFLKTFDLPYGLKVITSFKNNLDLDYMLTYAVIKQDFGKLKDLSIDQQKEFIKEFKKLIDKYIPSKSKNKSNKIID